MKKLLLVSAALLILSFGAFAQDPTPTPADGATLCAAERDTNPESNSDVAEDIPSGAGSQTLSDPAATDN